MTNKLRIQIILLVIALLVAGSVTWSIGKAHASSAGSVVLAPNGTVYLIGNTQKRGFSSAEVFFSQGYKFSGVTTADSADLSLPDGPVITYADGTLVKGSDPTVYIISGGLKMPFASATAFLGLGYSFANILTDSGNILQNISTGAAVASSTAAHPAGTLVNDSGTIYLVSENGRKGIPSLDVFNSFKYSFKKVVISNAADRALSDDGLLAMRNLAAPLAPSVPIISGGGTTIETNSIQVYTFLSIITGGGQLSYQVDWGDGSAAATGLTGQSGASVSAQHAWAAVGTYTITATATASNGQSAQGTLSVAVQSPAVVIQSPSAPAVTAVTGAYPVATVDFSIKSTDPNGNNLTYTIDWNDSTPQTTLTGASGAAVATTHAWSYIGDYNIAITVGNGKGGSASTTYPIKISSDPTVFGPAVTVLAPNGGETLTQGQPYLISWKRNWMPDQAYGKVDIFYSHAGANVSITTGVLDSSYSWIPVDLAGGSDYRIVVISRGSSSTGVVISDQSDGPFTINQVLGASNSSGSSGY
ncbi:hypothetical protein D4R52_03965 [bacterium]|nr:MAG: hypothetical protein D4R52_03965 [bacterium]